MARVSRSAAASFLAACLACASSPGSNPPPGEPAVGTFRTGMEAPSGSGTILPFSGSMDARVQTLYLASDVGAAGVLTGLRLHRDVLGAAGPVTCPQTTVRLGHSTLEPEAAASLTGAYAGNADASSLTTTFSGALVVDAAPGSWFDVPFTTPYVYDGIENLIVDVETVQACTGDASLTATAGTGNRRVFAAANDANPNAPDHPATGAVDGVVTPAQFLFAGGALRKEFPELGAAGNACGPFASLGYGLKQQDLVLASDLNAVGPVTGLAFQLYADPSLATTSLLTVRLGHTARATLGATFADNVDGTLSTVADRVLVSVPAGMHLGAWVWVPFTGRFQYDGVRNLVVQVEAGPQTGAPCGQRFQYASRAGAHVSANDATAAAGTVGASLFHLAFRLAGAPVHFGPRPYAWGAGVGLSTAAQWQTVIPAVQLGAGGTLRSVGLRLCAGSSLATIHGFELYLAPTSLAALGSSASYEQNLGGAAALASARVFSGELTIPTGLKTGDWLDVPLATPVVLDATRNLLVYLRTPGSGIGNSLCFTVDATQFPSQTVTSSGLGAVTDTGAAPPWPGTMIPLRLDLVP